MENNPLRAHSTGTATDASIQHERSEGVLNAGNADLYAPGTQALAMNHSNRQEGAPVVSQAIMNGSAIDFPGTAGGSSRIDNRATLVSAQPQEQTRYLRAGEPDQQPHPGLSPAQNELVLAWAAYGKDRTPESAWRFGKDLLNNYEALMADPAGFKQSLVDIGKQLGVQDVRLLQQVTPQQLASITGMFLGALAVAYHLGNEQKNLTNLQTSFRQYLDSYPDSQQKLTAARQLFSGFAAMSLKDPAILSQMSFEVKH
jgi:hypothetical protein